MNSNSYMEEFINKLKFSLNKFNYLQKKFSQEELDNSLIEKIYFGCNKIFKITINKNDILYNYVIKSTIFIWGETNNEYEILENIKNPKYIVPIYDNIFINNSFYYLMEFVNKTEDDIDLIKKFKQITQCVKELHDNNIIHLDIHKNNFIFDSDKKIYRVIDFELSKNKGDHFDISRMFGNSFKYPPEIHNSKRVEIFFDIFGLLTLFYELAFHRPIFFNKDEYVNKKIILNHHDERCNIFLEYILNNYQKINCDDILNFTEKNFNL